MAKWSVVDSQSGATAVYEGAQPPTEKQLDDLFAEQSISAGARAAATPAPAAPAGPGFMSRLGTALQTLPPVAAVERGASNIVNPLIAAGRAAWPYVRDVVAPEVGREAGAVLSTIGRGAENLVRPLIPSGADASALIGGPEAVKAWGNVFNPPQPPPQDMPPAGPITLPPAPLAKEQRVTGKVYLTPAGPRRWMGSAWQRLS